MFVTQSWNVGEGEGISNGPVQKKVAVVLSVGCVHNKGSCMILLVVDPIDDSIRILDK